MANGAGGSGGGGGGSADPRDIGAVNQALQQQLVIMNQLRQAIASMSESLSKYCETSEKCFSGEQWAKATEQAGKYAKDTASATKTTEQLGKKVADTAGSFQKMLPVIGGVAGGLAGLRQGFSNLFANLKGGINILGTVTKSIFNLGRSLLAVPFNILKGLQGMAADSGGGGGGGSGMAEALENLRKEVGFIGPTSDAVKSLTANMAGFSDTGLAATKVFGNAAERMKYLTELAVQMGPQFAANAEEFKKNGGALVAYQKGLGLTGEQMGVIGIKAASMGVKMGDVLNDMTKQALHMSKAFGLDAKVISKDMGKAMQDVAHFGHLTSQQLSSAVVYANKLGVSIDKLTGLMDQFDTFDKAAESTSMLNEQFGTNIDAMELMAAQSPAEKMEILRKSFLATGKDLSKLSFHERKLIQQQTGLDAATFDAAMAQKEQGDMLEKINKESKKAEDSTMKQADAMKQLAVQIERVVQSGGGGGGGAGGSTFLDSFIRGFTEGITKSKEFQRVLINLKQSMKIVGKLGFDLGKIFVEAFPGVQKILGGLAELFNPARFSRMADGVRKAIADFRNGTIKDFGGLMDRLKQVFFNFFNEGAGPGKKILEGFKDFFAGLIKIIAGLSKWVVDQVVNMITKFIDYVKNPTALGKPGMGGFFKMFEPLLDAFKYAFEKLSPLVGPLLKALGKKIYEVVTSPEFLGLLKEFGPKIALVLFGPSLLKSATGALTGSIASAATSAISSAFLGGGGKKISEMGAKEFAKMMQGAGEGVEAAGGGFFGKIESSFGSATAKLSEKLGPKLLKAFKFAGVAAVVVDAGVNISESIDKFSGDLEKKGFDPATAKIAAGTQGLINTITFGLLPEGFQQTLAGVFAKMYDFIFKGLDSAFGPGFSEGIKKFFAGQFETLAGIGDLALSLWNGDSQKTNAAFKRIAKGMFDSLMGAIETSVNILLKIGPLILEYLFKGLSWLSSKVGDILLALKDIPLIGGVFEFLGNAFKGLADVFTWISDAFGKLAAFFKGANVTNVLRETAQSIIDFFSAVWDKIKFVMDAVTLPIRILYNLVKTIFQLIWEEVISPVFGWIADKAKIVWDGITAGLKMIQTFFTTVFNIVYNEVIKPIFDAIWGAISPVLGWIVDKVNAVYQGFKQAFDWIWNTASEFINKVVDWGHRLLDILTEPGTKAKERLSNAFNLIWETITSILSWEKFKELGGKILDGLMSGLGAIKDKIKEKISGAVDSVKDFLGIRSPSTVFADMGGNMVDGMMKSFTDMPAKLREKFTGILKDVSGIFEDMNKMILEAVTGFLKTITDVFNKIIDGPVKEFPLKLKEAVEKVLPVVDKIFKDVLESIRKNFDAAFELVQYVTNKILSFLETNIPRALKVFKDLRDGIADLFSLGPIMKIFDALVDGILKALGKLAEVPVFSELIALAKKVFKISSPSKVFEDIGDNIVDGVSNSLSDLPGVAKEKFDAMAKQAEDSSGKIKMPAAASVAGPSVAAPQAPAMPDPAAIAGYKSSVTQLETLADSFSVISEKINKFSGLALINSFKELQNIASAVKELDDALAQIGKIDLKQRIAKVAGGAGLDGGGVYTVKSKDVNINIALQVTMDVGSVESAIISSTNSRIKKSINFAVDGIGKDADTLAEEGKNIKEPYFL